MAKQFVFKTMLTFALFLSGLLLIPIDPHSSAKRAFIPVAQAQSRVRNLLDRIRGKSMPNGIVKTNGRIEATQVDISAKYPGRLVDITADEGSEVKAGQVVGRIASPEYEAQLRAAQSNVVRAKRSTAEANAVIAQRTSVMALAKNDLARAEQLVQRGSVSQQGYEQRRRNYESADANVQAASAQLEQAEAGVKSADAEVERIQSVLHDMILVSPRDGRVQYQLARSGEVIPAGGKVLTVLDLKDVYMTIFLPAASAAKLDIGDEARIILDPAPQYVIPASVSFVASDAQFTPKTVETADEREKLMFRVKLQLDPQVLQKFYRKVKTGVRGIGVVRTDKDKDWPTDLEVRLPK